MVVAGCAPGGLSWVQAAGGGAGGRGNCCLIRGSIRTRLPETWSTFSRIITVCESFDLLTVLIFHKIIEVTHFLVLANIHCI